MWTALFAASMLVVPTAYAMTMIVLWAAVPQRALRTALVGLMALLPLWIVGHAAWQARDVLQAEVWFDEQCRALQKPVVHARAADVESIVINVHARPGNATAADLHPQRMFPTNEAARYLLEGAARYPRIEHGAHAGTYQALTRGDSGRAAPVKSPGSRYSVEWQSLESRSAFVTTGVMVVRDTAGGGVLAEQRTALFNAPRVTLLGTPDIGLYVLRDKTIACPTPRQIAHFLKSVARPVAAQGS